MLTRPVSRIRPLPYRRPAARRPGSLRLDGNEGHRPSRELLETLATLDAGVLRDYPDARGLERRLARGLGVEARRVVITAGADDALDRCCRAYLGEGLEMILPVPGFEMLHRFAATAGGSVAEVPWSDGAFPVDEVIARIGNATALIAMVTPNNPSGGVATAADLIAVASAARGQALVVLDQVYLEYAEPEATAELTRAALALDNVVVVRSFSKARGLAGCRIGYAAAAPGIADVLRSVGNPYPTAGLSLAVAAAQLDRGEAAMDRHVARVRRERRDLRRRLAQLGIEAPPAQGNFLLPDFGRRAAFVFEALRAQGVLVRWFAHRAGLESRLRITLPGEPRDYRRLVAALETCLAPEALLFDLDGVLADTSDSYDRAILGTARDFGCQLAPREVAGERLRGDAANDWELTRRLLAARGVERSLAEITERFQSYYLGSGGDDGLRARERPRLEPARLAAWARRRPLAVVTGRPRAEALWFLDRTGLSPAFSALVTMEDRPGKPDPAPVRLALERLGVERAWMLGDTPDDAAAAAGAGALAIGVAAPGCDFRLAERALLDAGAATVLGAPAELEELLP